MRRLIALWMSVGLTTAVFGSATAVLVSATVLVSSGVLAPTGFPVARAQDAAGEAEASDGTVAGSASGELPASAAGVQAQSSVATTAEPTVTATAGAEESQMDAATYAVRLRDLEQRIDALKEQIFRSKARLSLLAETVLGGVVAGAQAVIVHENRMSSSYRLVKAVYALDGARLFSKADEEGSLGDQQEFEIFNGSIVPGEHNITVNLEYRGHGYGIFSYLKGYRFRVRSSYTFTAPEGRAIQINVVGYEKGGPTAPLEERPAIRYVEQTSDLGRRTSAGETEGAQ